MKRKAIIIETSAVPDLDHLPGAGRDAETLEAWLRGNAGGAWGDEIGEIEVLHTPSVNLVKAHLLIAKHADYAFVAFSGHGEQPRGGDFDDTVLALRDGTITVRELNCGADRC